MLFDENDFIVNNYIFNDKDESIKIYDVDEGYIKGNMFKDEYKDYKNYTPFVPSFKSERERILYDIMKYNFFINDLNLYLDLHPDDRKIYSEFIDKKNILNKLVKEYESKYDSLSIESEKNNSNWVNGPWPFDKEEVSKYV